MLMRILLADDHTLFRELLREVLLRKGADGATVGEAVEGAQTLAFSDSPLPRSADTWDALRQRSVDFPPVALALLSAQPWLALHEKHEMDHERSPIFLVKI